MSERTPSPAVYGIETEYSCLLTLPGDIVYEIVGSCHSPDAQIGLYVEPKQKGSSGIPGARITEALGDMGIFRNGTGMLSNGGRLYIDPSGPEYATPETTTAEDAVLRSFEGDTILHGVFDYLRNNDVLSNYQLNRRVVDHNRSSRGIHLNTLTKLANGEPAQQVALWLATLNVAKGALFGSGGLLVDKEGNTAYHHSPRLSITTNVTANYASYHLRPLTRRPFKPDGRYLHRIETVTSDALNFGWPMRASLVVTNAVVGLIELGLGDKLPKLQAQAAVDSAQNVGREGPEGHVLLEGPKKQEIVVSSLHVIKRIADLVLEIDNSTAYLDDESRQVMAEIVDVADRMAEDTYSTADQVESVARLKTMERKMEKDGIKLDSERMCRFDYAWDWVGGGVAEALRSKGKIGWQGFSNLPTRADTKKRLITPPQDTRAKVRGDMIRLQKGTDDSSWEHIVFGEEERYIHPLQSQIPSNVFIPEDLRE